MAQAVQQKKRVIVSYNKLPSELKRQLKIKYPAGYTDSMIRIDKGMGEFFYAVLLETEETNYLVKIDVKVDEHIDNSDEEEDDYYDDDLKGADEIPDNIEEEEEGE